MSGGICSRFTDFLFAYLSFLPDTDVITLLGYSTCCVTHAFQLWR